MHYEEIQRALPTGADKNEVDKFWLLSYIEARYLGSYENATWLNSENGVLYWLCSPWADIYGKFSEIAWIETYFVFMLESA